MRVRNSKRKASSAVKRSVPEDRKILGHEMADNSQNRKRDNRESELGLPSAARRFPTVKHGKCANRPTRTTCSDAV